MFDGANIREIRTEICRNGAPASERACRSTNGDDLLCTYEGKSPFCPFFLLYGQIDNYRSE